MWAKGVAFFRLVLLPPSGENPIIVTLMKGHGSDFYEGAGSVVSQVKKK